MPRSPALLGPHWFASVMGTGIVATAAVSLPVSTPAWWPRIVWIAAASWLVVLSGLTAMHWTWHGATARGHLTDPVMAHFYGAPAMALMTVGAGALLAGGSVIGTGTAVWLDMALWTSGTVLGLWTCLTIPPRMRRAGAYDGATNGAWLMSVVPPVVSASTGALLVPHLPEDRQTPATAACWGLFVLGLASSSPMLLALVRRTWARRRPAPGALPTLFVVLGPLGQSVTAAHALGGESGTAGARFALAYGVPVLSAALVWAVVAVAIVVRAARDGLPFGLPWWSFTFPVGTVVTGASSLAQATHWRAFDVVAVVGYVALVGAWVAVTSLTVHATWWGTLLRPEPQTA